MSDFSFDPHIYRLNRQAGVIGAALDQLVKAGVLKEDKARTAAARTAADRRADSGRAQAIFDQHDAAYRAALAAGDLETAVTEHTAATAAGHVVQAASTQEHLRGSTVAAVQATLDAAQRALPAVREEFNAASAEFTEAYEEIGGRPFTLGTLLRDRRADEWKAMVDSAARLDTAAAVLEGLLEIETSGEADLTQRVTVTTRGLVEANALKAAATEATWLQDEDFTSVRRWLTVLVAAPRPGFKRPKIHAGHDSALEAKRLRDALTWLANHGGATNYADRVQKLTDNYWSKADQPA